MKWPCQYPPIYPLNQDFQQQQYNPTPYGQSSGQMWQHNHPHMNNQGGYGMQNPMYGIQNQMVPNGTNQQVMPYGMNNQQTGSLSSKDFRRQQREERRKQKEERRKSRLNNQPANNRQLQKTDTGIEDSFNNSAGALIALNENATFEENQMLIVDFHNTISSQLEKNEEREELIDEQANELNEHTMEALTNQVDDGMDKFR